MQTGTTAIERRAVGIIPSSSGKSVRKGEGIYVPRKPNGTSRKAVDRVESNRPHSLKNREFHNELCVQLKQGSFDVRNNFISNLYKCLKNHPDYQNDLAFTKEMGVNKILSLIRNRLEDLAPKNCNTIIEESRYNDNAISVTSYMDMDVRSSQQSMPLKWLLKLKRENPKLFVIVRNVISLIKGKYQIHGPNDGFSEMAQEYFISGIIDQDDEKDFKYYSDDFFEQFSAKDIGNFKKYWDSDFLDKVKEKDGVGYLLISEMADIYRMIDEDWLMNQINTYNPRNELYKALLDWAKQGMKLYNNHHDIVISDIVYVTQEEYEEGSPVTAMDFMKFEWNFRCEYWTQGVEMTLNEHAGQFGVLEPRKFSVLEQDNFTNHFDDRYEKFGKELEKWFDFGTSIYYDKIWDWE